jgi:hypothetical protein
VQKIDQITTTPLPPGGFEERELVAPLILLRFYAMLIGMSCEHSLGGSQALTKFCKVLQSFMMPPGVPNAPNPPKMGRTSFYLFTNLHKTASKQR